MKDTDRRVFLKLLGSGAVAASTLNASIAKALDIPANNCTGTINDVEHIVILMQENRPFDHYFGTLQGVRGFNDPRAVKIHLPLQNGSGTVPASVFLQPASQDDIAAGYGVRPNSGTLGGPATGSNVIPPVRVNPDALSESLGRTYLDGTDHDWGTTHNGWNNGQHDSWAIVNGRNSMFYMTREDISAHFALADAFTVGDAYHASVLGPTNPNRCYLWTGCIGNLDNLGPGGTDGFGGGPMTTNYQSGLTFQTFPEVLLAAGVTTKVYQDGGDASPYVGNYSDNILQVFANYMYAKQGTHLYELGSDGTDITATMPASGASAEAWQRWPNQLFDQFRNDVMKGTLPQVSWIVAPQAYCEHPNFPPDFGAWYISQVVDILTSIPTSLARPF
jgi:phospholipase C